MGAEVQGFMALRGLDIAKLVFKYPKFHKIIDTMNLRAQESGLPDATRVLVEKAHVNVKTVWDEQFITEAVLKEKPVIVVANHEFLIEPLILLSQFPSRKNLFAVAADFAGDFFGEAVQELTLPISFKQDLGAVLRNAKSIKRGIKLLYEGNAIVIFPKPTSKSEKWRSGIGNIIGKVLDREDIFLIMADIQGVGQNDITKIFFNTIGVKSKPLNYGLRISRPILIKDLNMGGLSENSKERILQITDHLENHYKKWVENHNS